VVRPGKKFSTPIDPKKVKGVHFAKKRPNSSHLRLHTFFSPQLKRCEGVQIDEKWAFPVAITHWPAYKTTET
jgi:hypothetical protein